MILSITLPLSRNLTPSLSYHIIYYSSKDLKCVVVVRRRRCRRHPYLLSSHVRTLAHCISTFYCTYGRTRRRVTRQCTRHDDCDGRHDDGKGQNGDGRHDNGDGQHNDGKDQQGDGQHDNGDGRYDDAARRRRWATRRQQCAARRWQRAAR